MEKIQYAGWALILVMLSASVYLMLPEQVRVDVQNTRTVFKVWESGSWVVGGIEYLHLYDGSKKMRASFREVVPSINGDIVTITRRAVWKDGIESFHTYTFDASVSDVELIPISEVLYCYNCQGKIVHFEFRNLLYDGITRPAVSPESFGHNMKVEWQDGFDWAKVYQQRFAPDKLIIRYRPSSPVEEYAVRLFDPVPGGTGGSKGLVIEGDGRIIFENVPDDITQPKLVFER